jgi:hypothetical protein
MEAAHLTFAIKKALCCTCESKLHSLEENDILDTAMAMPLDAQLV